MHNNEPAVLVQDWRLNLHRREVILELVENEVVEFSVALLDSVVVCFERIFQDVLTIQQSENVKLLVVPFVSKRLKRVTWMRLSK